MKLVTDRHIKLGAMMSQQFQIIFHAFDVWHMAKSLLKKLVKCSKAFPKVGLWTKTIINHFCWCCKECKECKECKCDRNVLFIYCTFSTFITEVPGFIFMNV